MNIHHVLYNISVENSNKCYGHLRFVLFEWQNFSNHYEVNDIYNNYTNDRIELNRGAINVGEEEVYKSEEVEWLISIPFLIYLDLNYLSKYVFQDAKPVEWIVDKIAGTICNPNSSFLYPFEGE